MDENQVADWTSGQPLQLSSKIDTHFSQRRFSLTGSRVGIVFRAERNHLLPNVKILHLNNRPLHEFEYHYSAPGGRLRLSAFPLLHGAVDVLPGGVRGLLITSDLQGFDWKGPGGAPRLLGEIVRDEVCALGEGGYTPNPADVGVILCGDLFSGYTADDRGATGDVETIWEGFAERFRWVAGVAGNHDEFPAEPRKLFAANHKIHFLDGDEANVDGLRIGGISGVMGNPRKPFRRESEDYVELLQRLCAHRLDILVLHEGPEAKNGAQAGNKVIRNHLKAKADMLVGFGHSHWDDPLEQYGQIQLLNVEARAVMLTAASSVNR